MIHAKLLDVFLVASGLCGCTVAGLPSNASQDSPVDSDEGAVGSNKDTATDARQSDGDVAVDGDDDDGTADTRPETSASDAGADATSVGDDEMASVQDATDDLADSAPDGVDESSPDWCPYSDWVEGACAPVCGTADFGPGGTTDGGLVGVLSGLTVPGENWNPDGVTGDGRLLHHGSNSGLFLSVPSTTAANGYVTTALIEPNDAAWSNVRADQAAITFDGATVILETASYEAFGEAPLQGGTLGAFTTGPFGTLNANLPAGGLMSQPVISADGLDFYYFMYAASNPELRGGYVASRPGADADFGAGAPLQGLPSELAISGISYDELTLFAWVPSQTTGYVLSRASKSVPWNAAPLFVDDLLAGGTPDYFVSMPTPDCRFLFTSCSVGGPAQLCLIPRL